MIVSTTRKRAWNTDVDKLSSLLIIQTITVKANNIYYNFRHTFVLRSVAKDKCNQIRYIQIFVCILFFVNILKLLLCYFQDRIEGEQTFTVIRSGNASQIQNGEIVVGDVMLVSIKSINDTFLLLLPSKIHPTIPQLVPSKIHPIISQLVPSKIHPIISQLVPSNPSNYHTPFSLDESRKSPTYHFNASKGGQ